MKLCPFCGITKGHLSKWKQKGVEWYHYKCVYCGAKAGNARTEKLARHYWEMRKP